MQTTDQINRELRELGAELSAELEATLRPAWPWPVGAAEVLEQVAWIHRQGNHWEVSERYLDSDEKARGWTEEPLYTTPPNTTSQLDRLHKENAELRAANMAFGARQDWWCERMFVLEQQRDALLEALKWYVETDEVDDAPGNEFWIEGRDRARAALKAAEEKT